MLPFLGQGLNATLEDVTVLADILQQQQQQQQPGEVDLHIPAAIAEYDLKRSPDIAAAR